MLKNRPDVVYAEVLSARDGDAYIYQVESNRGVDIRKSLFFAFAERGWAMIGMESLGMNLEDIFISVVDKSEEHPALQLGNRTRPAKRNRGKEKSAPERELGESLFEDAKRQRAEAAKQVSSETEEDDV